MEFVRIGKIVNTHGIKGDLKVQIHTDFVEERFKKGQMIYIDYQGMKIEKVIYHARMHKNHILIAFDDELDINLVEKYKGCSIYAQKEEELLDEGEFYVSDLIGLDVYNYGKHIGKVKDVRLYDHHDILVVEGEKDVMIPYVDAFVKEENLDKGQIFVELIEGFYDED